MNIYLLAYATAVAYIYYDANTKNTRVRSKKHIFIFHSAPLCAYIVMHIVYCVNIIKEADAFWITDRCIRAHTSPPGIYRVHLQHDIEQTHTHTHTSFARLSHTLLDGTKGQRQICLRALHPQNDKPIAACIQILALAFSFNSRAAAVPPSPFRIYTYIRARCAHDVASVKWNTQTNNKNDMISVRASRGTDDVCECVHPRNKMYIKQISHRTAWRYDGARLEDTDTVCHLVY